MLLPWQPSAHALCNESRTRPAPQPVLNRISMSLGFYSGRLATRSSTFGHGRVEEVRSHDTQRDMVQPAFVDEPGRG